MAFDTNYPNRKDRRKPFRKAKAVDRTCRNHGSCPYCQAGVEYKRAAADPADLDEQLAEGRSEVKS